MLEHLWFKRPQAISQVSQSWRLSPFSFLYLDWVLPEGERVGCPRLRQTLETHLHPKLHVFGHIHEGHGQVVEGSLTSVNASFLDHRYLPVNLPVTVTL